MPFRHRWVLRPFIGAPLEPNPLAQSDRRHGSASARATAPRTDHRPSRWSSAPVTSGPGPPRQHKIPGLQPSSCGSRRGQTRVRTAGGTGVSPGNFGTQPSHQVYSTAKSNAFAERFVRSIKDECLDRMILFGEASLRRALREYYLHYHTERNHQGVGNRLLEPLVTVSSTDKPIRCRERLGGMLNFYYREAA